MKQKKTGDASRKAAKPSIRKVGTMLGSGALCVLTIGTISVCGLVGQVRDTENSKETKAAEVTTTTVTERTENTYTALDTVNWRKASINEYELAQVVSTKAETTTKASETTTEKTTTSKAADETLDNVKLYATDIVNLRAKADKSSDVLAILDRDDEVIASRKTSDGWYAVKYGETEGYVMAEFLTETVPESAKTETAATTTAQKTETKAAATTTKKTTTAAETQTAAKAESTTTTTKSKTEESTSDNAVISYTDEEFEMLCYVLQGEVGNCSEGSKIAVANVVINRVKSSQFPNTIEGVLTAPNQFTAITSYYNRTKTPTQNTIDCAKRALEGEDNTNGAIFYYAPKYCGASTAAWFETLNFCFELDGQRYFKNW